MTIIASLCFFSWCFLYQGSKDEEDVFRRPSNDGLFFMNIYRQISTAKSRLFAFLGAQFAVQLWHSRLGHPASAIASELLSNKFLPTTGSNSLSFCHFGPLGKSSILPFQLSNFASNNPLDLIHFDVWSSPIASMRGSKYYALWEWSLWYFCQIQNTRWNIFLLKLKPYNLMVVKNTPKILFNNSLWHPISFFLSILSRTKWSSRTLTLSHCWNWAHLTCSQLHAPLRLGRCLYYRFIYHQSSTHTCSSILHSVYQVF